MSEPARTGHAPRADARAINVLYCEHNVDGTVGGSYFSLLYLVKGLDRSRFRPTVVFYTDHALVPAFRAAGIETIVWPRPTPFRFAAGLRGMWRWLGLPLLMLQKVFNLVRGFIGPAIARARFLKARGFDLVHLNNSVLYNHDWMLAASLSGTPCITHERGINERYGSGVRYFARRLAAVICISDAVRQQMHEHGADFGNLVTIPNGLDPDAMSVRTQPAELRAAWQLDPDAVVIVMVGNIKAWKGQDTLVRAMDQVRQSVSAARCLLVGDTSPADRDYERTLRELVRTLGLDEHVIFTGYQSQVADFLRMSDIVVHTSVLPEPFGRVILEAMACRKPVIASRAGAIPEIVVEGDTGLTFPPGDAEALAGAIVQVAGDRAAAERMGERGYDRLMQTFHIRRNVEATERLYERVLGAAD